MEEILHLKYFAPKLQEDIAWVYKAADGLRGNVYHQGLAASPNNKLVHELEKIADNFSEGRPVFKIDDKKMPMEEKREFRTKLDNLISDAIVEADKEARMAGRSTEAPNRGKARLSKFVEAGFYDVATGEIKTDQINRFADTIVKHSENLTTAINKGITTEITDAVNERAPKPKAVKAR